MSVPVHHRDHECQIHNGGGERPMTTTLYWVGTTLVADWRLTDVDGVVVGDATVTGEVSLPDDTTAAMTVAWVPADEVYRASFTPSDPGRHGWRLEATGSATGAVEGSIVVQRSVLGLPPITVDPTTDIGRVRLLATDLNEVTPLLTDVQIQALLDMEGGRVRRAAAQALDTIATSEALISKVIRTLDLSTDGAKVAAELRARAKALRDQEDQVDDDADTFGLEVVNFDPWAAYRRTGT
jgi:hypothetical protein